NWQFSFSDSKDGNSTNAFLSPDEKTVLLALDLLTPATGTIKRNQLVDFTVQATFNNVPVPDANIFFWVPKGSRAFLAPADSAQGIFKGSFLMPSDYAEKDWTLYVVAVSSDGKYRGQLSKNFSIETASISISVLELKTGRIEAGVPAVFVIDAAYGDGKPLEGPVIDAEFNAKKLVFSKISGTKFSAEMVFGEGDLGPHELSIAITDGFGNTGAEKFGFFVEQSFWLGLGQQAIWVPALLAVICAIALAWFFAKKASSKKGLKQKRDYLDREVVFLQNKYFNERSISEEAYRKKLNELKLELADTEKQLNIKKE
ncbi:MAG: hypothetical protein PHH08_03350, partial [Candidatus ainarchaeum sp.]|nr:hypothetical protein [Candidatus ainarchaeum sp.]